ncbi:MAG TPA: class I SAM-dependent methyltransferase [Verrucomicrobiae bacterium]|nr:class I SAM-dependent methyltransferase [Verrucomicrobiae bacterium]
MNSLAITDQELTRLVGQDLATLPPGCQGQINRLNREYRLLSPEELERHQLLVLKRIHETKLFRNAEENRQAFEAGWRENLQLCAANGVSIEALKPKYVRPYEVLRFQGRYICPDNPFLLDQLQSLTANLSFQKYFSDLDTIYEFGCGSGQFLHALSELFPHKDLFGLDWTESSAQLLDLVAQTGVRVKGVVFDMLQPDREFAIRPGSGVMTIGALEQLGDRFGAFLNYLLEQRPRVVIHHEPILDFYNPDHLFDYLAILWHRKRGYLNGYLGALRALEAEGRIKILAARSPGFGDPFHESTSFIAWEPV